jgi:TonB family protein
MLEEKNAEISSAPVEAGSEQKQRRQMLVALALLLVALILVLIKDRQFWFPSGSASESEAVEPTADATRSQSQTSKTEPAASVRAKAKPRVEPAPDAQTTLSPVITNRAVLPPLEVEVVAGDQRRTVQPGDSSVRVDLQPKPSTGAVSSGGDSASASAGSTTNASERVRLSPGTVEAVSRPVEPSYPLLARQMKVQGSVVLQALIGKDGNIQDLRVLTGPAILSTAAREAVKQWRFKPYLQAGQPVETEARITVNFTISTQ